MAINGYSRLLTYLKENSDDKYREFHTRLVTTSKYQILGVRSPVIKAAAKKLAPEYKDLLTYPDEYYEVVMIKGLVIAYAKTSYGERVELIKNFVPLIDNWAVCDSVVASLKFIAKNKEAYFEEIKGYLLGGEYSVRFALVCLLSYYIDDEYIDYILDVLKSVDSSAYYINMAAAWLLSVCYVKQREKTLALIIERRLSKFVQNKGIQKIQESFRVEKEEKKKLKEYKL